MSGDMKFITDLLPEGWREKARELNAFRRTGDYLKTPEDLLRVLLLWADLGTLGHTAAFLKMTGDFPMSKVALYQRVAKSAAWLEWLTVHFCREHEYLMERPEWLRDFRVTAVDATKATGKELYTLHMMIDLFSLSVVEQILTDATRGESMTNFQSVQKNDLALGDRAYGSITGMRWMEEREAYYVFRLKAKAFNLYQRNEKGHYVRFDLTEKLNDWEEGKTLCFSVFYRQGKTYFPVRVCARGKSAEEIEKGNKRIKASNSGEKRGKVTELQSVYNKFIVVVTNLPEEIVAGQILELYRMRWQIELVFKRLKSILDYDKLQTRTNLTSRAWFHCKLLTAAICEHYVQRGAFFPSGPDAAERFPALVMAGIRSSLRRLDVSAFGDFSR